jgi:hypothetical protein
VRRAARKIARRVDPCGFAARDETFNKGNRLRIIRHNGRCATRRRLGFGILGHTRTIREIASASPEFRGPDSARIERRRDRSEQRIAIKDGYRDPVCLVTRCGRPTSAEVLHINTDPVLVVAPGEELAKLNFKPSQELKLAARLASRTMSALNDVVTPCPL